MTIVDSTLLDHLSEKARSASRLRMNHNFHLSGQASCHRLLNAIEPGSYIMPHRHLDPNKDETFVIIRGKLGVIIFDDNGNITETALLVAGTDQSVANILNARYHTAVSLQPGTIFFEAKSGPYLPLSEQEKAGWAPLDNDNNALAYLQKLCALFTC